MALLVAQGFALQVPVATAQSKAATVVEERQVASVNINKASATELASTLSGVGNNRAEAIIRYREQFGPFESIDELSEVSGIGASTVERNRRLIRIE